MTIDNAAAQDVLDQGRTLIVSGHGKTYGKGDTLPETIPAPPADPTEAAQNTRLDDIELELFGETS